MKIANSNPAGPFGGVIAFQVAANGTAAQNTTSSNVSARALVDGEVGLAEEDND